MPDRRHEVEAERLLAELGAVTGDSQTLSQGRRLLAEALEQAERRGRERSGLDKESSG
jgi:mannose/cellobiose epimerase-like protein (N-acyl-D-glucosamine 2-epimerase family)